MGLPDYTEQPPGWLTIAGVAKRLNRPPAALTVEISKGGKWPRGGMATCRGRVILNWDDCIYDYLIKRDPTFRPADFRVNRFRRYAPIAADMESQAVPMITEPIQPSEIPITPPEPPPEPPDDDDTDDDSGEGEQRQERAPRPPTARAVVQAAPSLIEDQMYIERVTDLTSARYRTELLKIEKNQIELRKARGDLIEVGEVEKLNRQIAATIRAELGKVVARLSPALAAESDPRVVKKMLMDELRAAFAPLSNSSPGVADELAAGDA